MKSIYFIRHAQSEANLKDILASRKNFSLTDKGKADAQVIAAEFKGLAQLDRVISSPLIRAQQTAAAIASVFSLDIETDDRLTEQELGVYSGMTYSALNDCPDYMHDRSKRWDWEPEGGGESYQMIAARLTPFFKSLASIEGGSILFVTHAVTMRMIKAILEKTLPQYPHDIAKNGEIWKVNYVNNESPCIVESIFLGDSVTAKSRA